MKTGIIATFLNISSETDLVVLPFTGKKQEARYSRALTPKEHVRSKDNDERDACKRSAFWTQKLKVEP